MSATMTALAQPELADLHTRFLELLPRIEQHGRIYFRHLNSHQKAEAIQEMRALAWKWFQRLAQCGKNPVEFLATFNGFLVRAVNAGRRLVGMEKAKDVMCSRTQRRHGFRVEALPTNTRKSHEDIYSAVHGQQEHDAFEELLSDNTQTPVPDQAAFRIDWPKWKITRTERDRQIIDELMVGERTLDVSKKFGLSPARVSRLRRDFHHDWMRYNGDTADQQFAKAA